MSKTQVLAFMIQFLSVPVLLSVPFYGIYSQIVKDDGSRIRLARWLGWPLRKRYLTALNYVLHQTDKLLGSPLSISSLLWCLSIAFFYPFFLVLITWGISGQPIIWGNTVIFTEAATSQRLIGVVALAFSIFVAVGAARLFVRLMILLAKVFSKVSRRVILALSSVVFTILVAWFLYLTLPLDSVDILYIGIFLLLVVLLFIRHSIELSPINFLLMFSVVVVVSGSFISFSAVLFLFTSALSSFTAQLIQPNNTEAISSALDIGFFTIFVSVILFGTQRLRSSVTLILPLMLFIPLMLATAPSFFDYDDVFSISVFGLLPLVNGLLDFSSLAVSRVLLRRIADGERWRYVVLHIFIDVVLAVTFLILLTVLMVLGIEALERTTGQSLNWRLYANSALETPFSSGLAITLMLLSTLIPTIAHLFVALLALCVKVWPWHSWLQTNLQQPLQDNLIGFAETASLCLIFLLLFGILLGVIGLISYIIALFYKPLGQILYELALWVSHLL